jgi:mono/diheme cytochrome c family protein
MQMNRGILALVALLVVAGAAVAYWQASMPHRDTMHRDMMAPVPGSPMHGAGAGAPARPAGGIVLPQLSSPAQLGKVAFDENCAACHGENAAGTGNGPPLIHKIYEPSHHGDFAFQRAVRQGVRAHHWEFGDMAPVPGLTDRQIEWITRYVRELQRANGIM